ncbi:MAG TPA: DUF2127 domain-containing protein [Steroidobacteraceae bacterium]
MPRPHWKKADLTPEVAERRAAPVGLRLIVGFKFAKAAVELLPGALLLLLGEAGLAGDLKALALFLRHHATEAWSIALAERLVHAATERNVLVVAVAALLDGALTLIEAYVLHRRYRWSRWLVIGTTSCALPVEIVALVLHPTAGRMLLLLVNLLIVLYLLQRQVAVTS